MKSSFIYDIKTIKEIITKNYDKIMSCLDKGNIPKLLDGTRLIDINKIFETKYV